MVNLDAIKINILKLKRELPHLNIDSIFVEQDGKIDKIFYSYENLHELRSCAKVLVAMATGIAIDRNMLSLNTYVYPFIKDKVNITKKENLEKIKKWKIIDLLTHTTGYESQMMSESYIKDIDKNKLLDYALNYDIPHEVGKRYAYNNLEPFIISVIFQEKFGINLTDFINENIFKKINVKEYKWDNYGKYCPASTGLYLNHNDFHKIGQLLLNDGKYNNIQVVPEYWIKGMCSLKLETPSSYKKERLFPKVGIGYYMVCMGAILYEEFGKIVYAATLQDSNDNYCPEIMTNINELAKYSNNKIEIIKGLHRDKAIEVLKTRGESI